MSPEHDITLRGGAAECRLYIDFSGTPHPQQREDIRRAFDILLDSLFEHPADSAVMAFNIQEKAGWIGRPTPPPQPPLEGE